MMHLGFCLCLSVETVTICKKESHFLILARSLRQTKIPNSPVIKSDLNYLHLFELNAYYSLLPNMKN